MLWAEDPLLHRQEPLKQVSGGGRVSRLPGPAGEASVGGQGVRVLRAQHPLADGQQGGELVAGPGRIASLPGPVCEVVAGP